MSWNLMLYMAVVSCGLFLCLRLLWNISKKKNSRELGAGSESLLASRPGFKFESEQAEQVDFIL